jgi:hypothetical protein
MNSIYSQDLKKITTSLVEVITKEAAFLAKSASSTKPISIKSIKDKYLQTLIEEINKTLPN